MTGAEWVAVILAGGLGVPTAVFLLARTLVERHADATAAAIRQQHTQPVPVQTRPRQKELTYQ